MSERSLQERSESIHDLGYPWSFALLVYGSRHTIHPSKPWTKSIAEMGRGHYRTESDFQKSMARYRRSRS